MAELNHQEALEIACIQKEASNLARCYLDLVQQLANSRKQNALLRDAINVLENFGTTVAPSSSFWEEIWPEYEKALAEKQEYIQHIGDILGQDWRSVSLESHATSVMQQLAAKDSTINRLQQDKLHYFQDCQTKLSA